MNLRPAKNINSPEEKIVDNAIQLTSGLINAIPGLCRNCKLMLKESLAFEVSNTSRRQQIDGEITGVDCDYK